MCITTWSKVFCMLAMIVLSEAGDLFPRSILRYSQSPSALFASGKQYVIPNKYLTSSFKPMAAVAKYIAPVANPAYHLQEGRQPVLIQSQNNFPTKTSFSIPLQTQVQYSLPTQPHVHQAKPYQYIFNEAQKYSTQAHVRSVPNTNILQAIHNHIPFQLQHLAPSQAVHHIKPQVHITTPIQETFLASGLKYKKVPNIVEDKEEYEYPKYKFAYTVSDAHSGDNKSHQELRDGDAVKGQYSLVEPNGSIRKVVYHADDHSGFNAEISTSAPVHGTKLYSKSNPVHSHLGPFYSSQQQYYHH